MTAKLWRVQQAKRAGSLNNVQKLRLQYNTLALSTQTHQLVQLVGHQHVRITTDDIPLLGRGCRDHPCRPSQLVAVEEVTALAVVNCDSARSITYKTSIKVNQAQARSQGDYTATRYCSAFSANSETLCVYGPATAATKHAFTHMYQAQIWPSPCLHNARWLPSCRT